MLCLGSIKMDCVISESYYKGISEKNYVKMSFGIIYAFSVLFLLYFRARLFIDALWSPAGNPLVSWVGCGA